MPVLERGRVKVDHEEDFAAQPQYAPFLDNLRDQGVRTVASVPMFFGHACIGMVALRFDHRRPFSRDDEQVALGLAGQVTVALEMARLAKQAKQAAVAREREEAATDRAAELAEANQIIRTTIQVMTSIPALDEFIGTVMAAINASLGAAGSTLWLLDLEREHARLAMTVLDGQWHREPPAVQGASHKSEFPLDRGTADHFVRRLQPRFTADIRSHPSVDPGTRAWLEGRGVVGLQQIPFRVWGDVFGILDIHRPDNEPFSDQKLQLAIALAQQVGLAIHITRLSERVKEDAVAREQERAELAKATELLNANLILRETAGALTAGSEIEQVIGQVMAAMNGVLGHDACTLWLWGRERMTTRLHMILYAGEKPVYAADTDHPARGIDFPMSLEKYVEHRLEVDKLPVVVDDIPACDSIRPEHQEFMKQVGANLLVYVPMVGGDRVVGTFLFRSSRRPRFEKERMELVQALA